MRKENWGSRLTHISNSQCTFKQIQTNIENKIKNDKWFFKSVTVYKNNIVNKDYTLIL